MHSHQSQERREKTARHWGDLSDIYTIEGGLRSIAWAEHPLVAKAINRRITSDENNYWVKWALERYTKPGKLIGLSIGCGSGYIERYIIDNNLAFQMHGVDISYESIRKAKNLAEDRNITYAVLDLNTDTLKPEFYDFCVSAAALHHITNLEHCLCQISKSLKKDGVLILNEYIGADRFQFDDKQLEIINRIYAALPSIYKYNQLTGYYEEKVKRKPLGHIVGVDPSEAVRSSEIPSCIEDFFEVVEKVEYGGSILHPLLEGIAGNFKPDDPLDCALLNMLISLEENLIHKGILKSDFVVMVCKPKKMGHELVSLARRGLKKMDIIERQEKEIIELTRRLEEAEMKNRELASVISTQSKEISKLRSSRDLLEQENNALKSTGILKILRLLKYRFQSRKQL